MKSNDEAAPMLKELAVNDAPPDIDGDAELELQMAQCGLSIETKRFMRNLHLAEKHLNDAFETVHGEGDDAQRQQQVSQLYHDLFGSH